LKTDGDVNGSNFWHRKSKFSALHYLNLLSCHPCLVVNVSLNLGRFLLSHLLHSMPTDVKIRLLESCRLAANQLSRTKASLHCSAP